MSAAALRVVDAATPVFDDGTTVGTLPFIVVPSSTPGPGLIGSGSQSEVFADATGAAAGDFPVVSYSGDLQGVAMTARLDISNNIVLIALRNDTGAGVTLSGTFYTIFMKAF